MAVEMLLGVAAHRRAKENRVGIKPEISPCVFALGIGLTTLCCLQMMRGMDNMKYGTGKIE